MFLSVTCIIQVHLKPYFSDLNPFLFLVPDHRARSLCNHLPAVQMPSMFEGTLYLPREQLQSLLRREESL